MRRLGIALLLLCRQGLARQPTFSIHDDVFAHPQFEVVFSDNFVSEQEAQSLLELAEGDTYASYSAEFPSESDLARHVRAAGPEDPPSSATSPGLDGFSYEIMNMPPHKYLCSIPLFDEALPENQTAADLAKAEEAKELARASRRGWELLAPMGGQCLHFMSGWWSYRFCYGKSIVQYHALPQVPQGMPPVQDPDTLAYMLGRAPDDEESEGQGQGQEDSAAPPNTELGVKDDQRYLVQRLGGGTVCDLTGRERTIEVQYHCVPAMKADRIGWIKEVTTCAYLMVINTPRLCDDVAFLPPRDSTANPITCRPILSLDTPGKPRARTLGASEPPSGQVLGSKNLVHPPVVGGVVVGGHNIIAGAVDEGFTLDPPSPYISNARGGGKVTGSQPAVEVVATGKSEEDGGEVWIMSEEEMEVRDMDYAFVESLVQELRDLAGERGWRLEVVEIPGNDRELRGIVDIEPGENLGTLARERDEAAAVEEEGEGGEDEEAGSQEYHIADEL